MVVLGSAKGKRKKELKDEDDSDLIEINNISSSVNKSKQYSIDSLLEDHRSKKFTNIWSRINQIKLLESASSSQDLPERQPTVQELYEDLPKYQWIEENCHSCQDNNPFLTERSDTLEVKQDNSSGTSSSLSSSESSDNLFESILYLLESNPFALEKFASTFTLSNQFVIGWIDWMKRANSKIENTCYICWQLITKCKTFHLIEPTDSLLFDLFQVFLLHYQNTNWALLAFVQLCKTISFSKDNYLRSIERIGEKYPQSIDSCLYALKQINPLSCQTTSQALLNQQTAKYSSSVLILLKESKVNKNYHDILRISILVYYGTKREKMNKELNGFIKQLKQFESGIGVFEKESLTLAKDILFQFTCEFMNIAGAYDCKKNPLQTNKVFPTGSH